MREVCHVTRVNAAVRLRQKQMEGDMVPAVATLMQALHHHTLFPPHILAHFPFSFPLQMAEEETSRVASSFAVLQRFSAQALPP
jgi:hypothetical protein